MPSHGVFYSLAMDSGILNLTAAGFWIAFPEPSALNSPKPYTQNRNPKS